jgi:Lrp/AsnC family leucine-responsive transcriptional regulator
MKYFHLVAADETSRTQRGSMATLDAKDCDILTRLQANARVTFAELGRQVGLSTPAVIERVRQLEENKVILGYHAQINPAAVGLPVAAMVRITIDGTRLKQFGELARQIPEVLECHRVTGNESYIVQVAVRDTQHLEEVIDSMMPYVSTKHFVGSRVAGSVECSYAFAGAASEGNQEDTESDAALIMLDLLRERTVCWIVKQIAGGVQNESDRSEGMFLASRFRTWREKLKQMKTVLSSLPRMRTRSGCLRRRDAL